MRVAADWRPVIKDQPEGPPDFDPLAGIYRWIEYASFGPWLWLCRSAFLPDLADCRRAAVLGDGDGRFTARLLAANPEIRVDAVDASEAMLRSLARRAKAEAHRVNLYHADARRWQPEAQIYNAVATHFFLDCLTTDEVHALARRMRNAVTGSAVWVISEFAVPEGRFMRLASQAIVSLLYRAFGLLTGLRPRSLPDYAEALRDAGFTLEKKRTCLGGLLVSELWRVQGL